MARASHGAQWTGLGYPLCPSPFIQAQLDNPMDIHWIFWTRVAHTVSIIRHKKCIELWSHKFYATMIHGTRSQSIYHTYSSRAWRLSSGTGYPVGRPPCPGPVDIHWISMFSPLSPLTGKRRGLSEAYFIPLLSVLLRPPYSQRKTCMKHHSHPWKR